MRELKLVNNQYGDVREVQGFSKDKLLDVKKKLSTLKETGADDEASELDEYLNETFPQKPFEEYQEYLDDIERFINKYLLPNGEFKQGVGAMLTILKSQLLAELQLISSNLLNLKVNAQNSLRFKKNDAYLTDFMEKSSGLLKKGEDISRLVKKSIKSSNKVYDNDDHVWKEANKIKNLKIRLHTPSKSLAAWEEIREIYEFVGFKLDAEKKRKKRKKKVDDQELKQFNQFLQYFQNKHENSSEFYQDVFHLLFKNGQAETDSREFQNVLERKEVKQKLEKFIGSLLKMLIKDEFNDIWQEVLELQEQYDLGDEEGKIQGKNLLEQQPGHVLPHLMDLYLEGIEKKYQDVINKTEEHDEFTNISKFYNQKISLFSSKIGRILGKLNEFKPYLAPYQKVSEPTKKMLENLKAELERRNEEYLNYIKTIRKERLREKIRKYVSDKTTEINQLMSQYQDETALIIREEFPQLKKIEEIIKSYKQNIMELKSQVIGKLEEFKNKDIDIYQIIKNWEDNFANKKQQLTFLLSTLLTKIYKKFKDLLESEEMIFDGMKELKPAEAKPEDLAMNYSLTDSMIDNLTEKEIKERTIELRSKINELSQQLASYQEELVKVEQKLEHRIKLREGILTSDVVCSVCHKHIKLGKEQMIKCPFCEAIFHYLCVAFWLSKYNSCPSCQNQFLDPNAGLFEVGEEQGEFDQE